MLQKEKLLKYAKCVAIVEWLLFLRRTDAVYVGYFALGILGLYFLLFSNKSIAFQRYEKYTIRMLSVILSFAVALANYGIVERVFYGCLILLSGYWVFEQVLTVLYSVFVDCNNRKSIIDEEMSKYVFWGVFLGYISINLLYLFLGNYPGNLTVDGLSQIKQVLTGEYTNHHPYWHTQLLRAAIWISTMLGYDVNAAVAIYNAIQIILMALYFAFAVLTAYKAGVGLNACILAGMWYLIMPYHVFFSMTVFKDVLFAGNVLLLVTALYRIFTHIGRDGINYAALIAGLLGTALMRNNGWLAILATGVIFCGGGVYVREDRKQSVGYYS